MQTIREIYDSKAAQTDGKYRAWLTDLNYCSKMAVGCELYGSQTKIRRMFLSGMDAGSALRRIQGMA